MKDNILEQKHITEIKENQLKYNKKKKRVSPPPHLQSSTCSYEQK